MAQTRPELIPTRASLLARLKQPDDQASWQEFFDTYWEIIYLLARKAGLNDAEGQDVVQETMVAAAQRMPTFRYDPAIGSFKTWLLNITRWRIGDLQRKRHKFARHAPRFGEMATLDESATSTHTVGKVVDPQSLELNAYWDTEWEKHMLSAATARVRRQVEPQKYQMFDLYVNKGWAPEKVAATFNVPVGQVYMAKHRILQLIKEEVRRLGSEMV